MKGKFVIILIIITLFFNFKLQTLAFDAMISSNQSNINVNDYVTLQIEVQMDNGKDLEIEEIKGLENFEVISRSQSQAYSTSISVINGKAEAISRSVNLIDFVLKPLSKGIFLLGPVVIKGENETKETNFLEISVLEDKILVQTGSSSINEMEEIINTNLGNDDVSIKWLSNKYIIYLFILGLLIILFIAGFIFYTQENKFGTKNNKDIEDENDMIGDDFEKEEIESYPRIDDEDFVANVEKILQVKLSRKYDIKDIGGKSYDEILDLLNDNLVSSRDKKILEDIIDDINKLKYSDILISKTKLLEMIRRI